MRRSIPLALTVLLAGCATAPQQPSTPQSAPASAPQPRETGSLTGLSVQDLVAAFGTPALQIREGNSLKLQFRGSSCVLDAYLYPSGSLGAFKVTHVDTRLPSGNDTNQEPCIAALRHSS